MSTMGAMTALSGSYGCSPAGIIFDQGTANILSSYNTIQIGAQTSVQTSVYAYPVIQTFTVADTITYYQNYQTYQTGISNWNVNIGVAAYVETKEEHIKRLWAERKWRRAERARRARATETLVSTLTDEQRKQFEATQTFELQVNNKLYRIRPGARVERIDPKTKKVLSYFCIHPPFSYELPAEDVALSQKLLLEAAESDFLKIANETKAA